MLNRRQQSSLVAMLRDAMNRLGLTQKELASRIGTSAGTLSAAFSLKGQMRDDRWRMCCEICSVDFDRFMDSQQHEAGPAPVMAEQGGRRQPTSDSECLHSPSVASAGPAPVMAEPEQTEPEEKEASPMPDVMKNTVSVELTATQCLILKNFIEDELFPVIRTNHELGSFAWLSGLVDAHHTLAKAVACHEECSA